MPTFPAIVNRGITADSRHGRYQTWPSLYGP